MGCFNWASHCGTFDNRTKMDDVVWIYRAGHLEKKVCVATRVPLSPVSQCMHGVQLMLMRWKVLSLYPLPSINSHVLSLWFARGKSYTNTDGSQQHRGWESEELLLRWISFSGLWVLSMSAYVKLLAKWPCVSFLEDNLLWDFLEISWLLSPFSLP